MKLKDLIEALKEYDPELEIGITIDGNNNRARQALRANAGIAVEAPIGDELEATVEMMYCPINHGICRISDDVRHKNGYQLILDEKTKEPNAREVLVLF